MKTMRHPIFLPIFVLIAFLGFGAGTALADSSSQGVGGWNAEATGTGQVSLDLSGSPDGIDGSGDARFTADSTGSSPKRKAFVGTLGPPDPQIIATLDSTAAIAAPMVGAIAVELTSPVVASNRLPPQEK